MDNIGVAGLKDNGKLSENSKTKAEILLKQFTSVFTREDTTVPLPSIDKEKYPCIEDITIDENGVLKLIRNLNVPGTHHLQTHTPSFGKL